LRLLIEITVEIRGVIKKKRVLWWNREPPGF